MKCKEIGFMKTEFKKRIVFTIMLAILTSTYAAFLNTLMKQGFLTDHFLINWLRLVPRTFLFVFPFILIMGPVIKALVDRMFRSGAGQNTKQSPDLIDK